MITGFLERYNADCIAGWAVLPNEGADSSLLIKIDGKTIGEVKPDRERPDLDNGGQGFCLELTTGQAPNKVCKLEVCSKESGTQIGNSPVITILASEKDRKNVLVGKDGQLFLTNDTNRVIDQIKGELLLQTEQLEKWRLFANNLNEIEAKGIECHFLVVPNKECVFSNLLPNGIALSPHRPIFQIHEILEKHWWKFPVAFSYPLEILKDNRYGPNYTPGDTHWTTYGAWCAVESIFTGWYGEEINLLRKEIIASPAEFSYENADLLSKLGGNCVETKPLCPLTGRIYKTYDNGGVNTDSQTTWAFDSPEIKKKILFFHDSFGLFMVPYLARIFGQVHTVWSPNLNESIIVKTQPDMILIERVERFLVLPSMFDK